ncbi:MAG: hypothetical protein H6953_18185 [Chromatiaceae bacterium]|nr:hypothetical protein [Chromatiaceae bacterium]
MTTIKTTLNGIATRHEGKLEIPMDAGFSSLAQLGLLLGMIDPTTHCLPTDADGVKDAARRLDYLMDECLDGLSGIGAALSVATLEGLSEDGLGGLGRLITNVVALAQAVRDGKEQLSLDPRFPKLRP